MKIIYTYIYLLFIISSKSFDNLCDMYCKTCNKDNKCSECLPGYILSIDDNNCIVKPKCECKKCDEKFQCIECNEGYEIKENKCVEKKCLDCVNCSNGKCSKCFDEFILVNGKCFKSTKFEKFLDELKTKSPKVNKLIDYVKKNSISTAKEITKEINNNAVENFRRINERECKLKINEFIINFEQNIQMLLSLSNLFEQRTVFEIEKIKNGIIDVLSTDNIDPGVKSKEVFERLNELNKLIESTFSGIKNKVKEYESISNQKIERTKNFFYNNLRKFLK